MKTIENALIDHIIILLLKLNKHKNVLTPVGISDCIEDQKDYKNLIHNINKRLTKIETFLDSNDELLQQLLRLHIDIMDIAWHFDEVHNILKG